MTSDKDLKEDTVSLVERAVAQEVAGNRAATISALRDIDDLGLLQNREQRIRYTRKGAHRPTAALVGQLPTRRPSIEGFRRAVHARDGYTCRYCGCRTVSLELLRVLAARVPSELRYHAHWKIAESSAVFWTISASIEHHVPVARGGASKAENLVTSCYECNEAKGDFLAGEVGWVLRPLQGTGWLGLTEFVHDLPNLAA